MKKSILSLVLALGLIFNLSAFAGARTPSTDELLQRINKLTRELNKVKQQLEEVKATQDETSDTLEEVSEKVEGAVAAGAGRLELSGDYRFRMDSTRAHVASYYYYNSSTKATSYVDAYDPDNDVLYTNRLRLNIKAKATENIVFKGRLSMYKIWGMESANATAGPVFGNNGYIYDPNISRRPNDNTLRVEMAYVNWTNIADLPIWFSIGRRPTVDGPPLQLKYNYDKRYATPTALGVDWTFDGLTLGYMYTAPFPGKIRICYGRGYESGFKEVPGYNRFDDVDLYGISWDVINDPDTNMFANVQLFKAADVTNFMEYRNIDTYALFDPSNKDEAAQLGDIYHLSGVFMHKLGSIDYFVSGGLSRTDNRYVDPNGQLSGLLNAPGEDENHWGWAAYVGFRVPVEALNSKIGLEYNYGSRYWINFTPAADDLYMSKLATRGHVAEVYWIWDIPDTPISKYAKAFIRAGYQYYWINYTGSGNWMGKPVDMDDLKSMTNYQTVAPVDRMDNAYLTFEVYF